MLTDDKGCAMHFKNETLVMTRHVCSSRMSDIVSDAKNDDDVNEMHVQINQVAKEELE